MSFFSSLAALGKIAGAVKSVMRWFSDERLVEAGRNDERSEIASQESENDEKIRTIRNRVDDGADADGVFDRFKNRRKE